MNVELGLVCLSCGAAAYAGDEFCEQCGSAVAEPRDGARNHQEVDAGVAAGVSDRGLVHRRNDDAMFVGVQDDLTVAVVCDGVSSSEAPQVAALLAAEVIGRELLAGSSPVVAVNVADQRVRDLPWTRSPGRTAPSCTAIAALVDSRRIDVAWAGDSRAYWLTTDAATQLTADHSWAYEQVAAGVLTHHEAAADRRAHMITRWLGEHGLDDSGLAEPVAHTTLEVREAGRLVICSDGLWAHVLSDDLVDLQRADGSMSSGPLGFARALTAEALARGGTDNITVVVVDVDPIHDRTDAS